MIGVGVTLREKNNSRESGRGVVLGSACPQTCCVLMDPKTKISGIYKDPSLP